MNHKNRIIRILSLALALVLITSVFSACKKKEEEENTGSTGSTASNITLRVFNSKGENASQFKAMCDAFTSETGIKTEAFSVGAGEDTLEPLRAQMQSNNPPAIFSIQGLKELPEWQESGAALDLNTVTDTDLKTIIDAIPQDMRLSPDGTKSFGIPYNLEGYGYIVDPVMLDDLFGNGKGDEIVKDLRTCSYDYFITFCNAVNSYIKNPASTDVKIGDHTYTFRNTKTGRAVKLNGIFAFAGSQKWTYGDHTVNVALNAVLKNPREASTITETQFDELKEPLKLYAETLDYVSSHVGGLKGPAARSRDLISDTSFGYDQSIQMLADGNALFLQQGNWAAANIANVSEDVSKRVVFIPIKMPMTDSVVKTGITAAEFNSSIPVYVPNYYAINSKVSTAEKEAAYKFLAWMHKKENTQKYIVDSFKFIPWYKAGEVTVTDSLSNSIISYVNEKKTLAAPYHGAPVVWSSDTLGIKIMEEYMIKTDWTEADYNGIADYAISSWKNLIQK